VLENLDWYQRTWSFVREEPGLVSEKGMDLCQIRTWTCIIQEPGLVSEKDLDLHQRKSLDLSGKSFDFCQRMTWDLTRE